MSTPLPGIQALSAGCCGCGRPELYYESAKEILIHFSTDFMMRDFDWIYRDRHCYLAVNALDSLGILEHGGSLSGSWLTPTGKDALKFLEAHGTNPDTWPPGSPHFLHAGAR